LSVLTERHVTPSILAADFADLSTHVREIMDAGCRVIHCDVMDGHFVPPITFGPMVVSALRESLPDEAYLDVHLMIERPERHVAEFAKAGADGITIHVESTPNIAFTLSAIRDLGLNAGLVVSPGTPPTHFGDNDFDLALIMTVNPGWGGQPFLTSQLDKVKRVRAMLGDAMPIEVDGGVNPETAAQCAEAGATWFVAGSAIFGADDPAAAYREIAAAAGC
jgi:ribulose-phosphate 3-epimerase